MMENRLWKMEPVGRAENTIQGKNYRFTLLTDCLIRMEYREDGVFEDRPTQTVWNRRFEEVPHRVRMKAPPCEARQQNAPSAERNTALLDGAVDGEGFELFTERMQVSYDGKAFSKNGLSVKAVGGLHPYGANWRFGENDGNLKGTARTLDEADGACELEDGIQSFSGCAVLDDSASLLLSEDGWIAPRQGEGIDIYLFAYGSDYKAALKDYYRLTGETPMLPRYALGNWWSRYYAYSEERYMELIRRFQSEKIPFSVAVIDMDWHLVSDVDPKYGSGWTGYTWNRKLFPEPERFLGWLHEQGMHITLNLHPADGVRAYEEAYPRMAEKLGNVDTENEEPIPFDIANPQFLKAYFDCVLHPEEDRGVDFWWIDWQQGNTTRIPGLDPLWMLNHYHFLDSARDGKRPMTFSRYAGPGSHRYPIGFSGDTVMTWESLQFQPYFTATASNIGFGWWSHDIGGHMLGCKDNDMAVRWLQLGVFSPINRLHSSCSPFNGKEPWRYPMEIHQVMNEFLRFRHRMLPYLYTMNYRAYREGLPLILPMYYEYPTERAAYRVKNQYLFGTELMAAPITSPQISGINMGKVHAWLPEGLYFDIFTGMHYRGGREMDLYRDIHSIPVLAKAGAILPLTGEIMGEQAVKNPSVLSVCVYAGSDGAFTLYEDDNETTDYLQGDCVTTEMKLDWEKNTFTIEPAKGNLSLLPSERTYEMCFYGLNDTDVTVWINGEETVPLKKSYKCDNYECDNEKEWECGYESILESGCISSAGCLRVLLPAVSAEKKVEIRLQQAGIHSNGEVSRIFRLLNQAEIPFVDKERAYALVKKAGSTAGKVAELYSLGLDADLAGAIAEVLTADE